MEYYFHQNLTFIFFRSRESSKCKFYQEKWKLISVINEIYLRVSLVTSHNLDSGNRVRYPKDGGSTSQEEGKWRCGNRRGRSMVVKLVKCLCGD